MAPCADATLSVCCWVCWVVLELVRCAALRPVPAAPSYLCCPCFPLYPLPPPFSSYPHLCPASPRLQADMEMIDSMALAIKAFEGGVVVISHDFRLLSQIGGEVWVVENGVRKFDGDIRAYKTALSKAMSAGISGAEAEKTVGKGGKSASTKGAAAGGAGAGAKPAAGGAGKGKFG